MDDFIEWEKNRIEGRAKPLETQEVMFLISNEKIKLISSW